MSGREEVGPTRGGSTDLPLIPGTCNFLAFEHSCDYIWAKNRPEPQGFGDMQYQSCSETSENDE